MHERWTCNGTTNPPCRPGDPCTPNCEWTPISVAATGSLFSPLTGSPSMRGPRTGRRRLSPGAFTPTPPAPALSPSFLSFVGFVDVLILMAAVVAGVYGRSFGPLEWAVVAGAWGHLWWVIRHYR